MVNYALDNLRAEGIDGVPWAPRKSNAVRNKGRRLLIDTGDGERSIRGRADRNSAQVDANEYMGIHNKGGTFTVRAHKRTKYDSVMVETGTYSIKTKRANKRRTKVARIERGDVKAHTRVVPARTFIAPTKVLFTRIETVLIKRLNTLLK